ncbi:hypothetical protein [Vibrio coralliilyticus]|uniref:hypothetical protein n=1 Tax=Vibrio coralliilyticus TaxID=190893 RepID=UPI0017B88EFD|nr:hypothetical protein [Vibrio coralliilyticus]NUW68083.1 hypothetical protein [Vibrio coralliilyticus]
MASLSYVPIINRNSAPAEIDTRKTQESSETNSLLTERLQLNQTLLEVLLLHVEFSGASSKNSLIPFSNLSLEQNENIVSTQDQHKLYSNLILINESYLEKLEEGKLQTGHGQIGNQPYIGLVTKANHFLETIVSRNSSNIEDDILDALKEAVDEYAERLEDINAWTEGGTAVIRASLKIMLDSILESSEGEELSYCDLQDIFQIIIIDMLSNPEDYPGIEDLLLDPEFVEAIGDILEFTGSGGHKPPEKYGTGEDSVLQLMEAYAILYDALMSIAPEGTLAGDCFEIIEDNGGLDKLQEGVSPENYWTDPEGWNNHDHHDNSKPPGGETADRLTPFRALSLLCILVEDPNVDITPEQWEIVLSGDIEAINDLIYELTDGQFDDYFAYMAHTDPNWSYGSGGEDFNGQGISPEYFWDLFLDFPPRELTDEEIEEINRIGDAVKMLMETMKYWIQICADNQMAMARNI